MARWAPARQDVIAELAREITGVYTGRAIVAIMADDERESAAFGQELAEAVTAGGRTAVLSRDGVGAADGVVTIVVGPAARRQPTAFHVRVWLDHDRPEDARERAEAAVVFDLSEPEHPRRRFADSC
ncbi:MAG: hypothetical protein QM635_05085 [Microbacteriaceae bacterium]